MSELPLGAGLRGRGVLVTGAAGAIGAAVARSFAACGARVVVSDLRAEGLEATMASLPGDGHTALTADLTDVAALDAFLARADSECGGLVALAHLAAVILRRADLMSISEADWDVQVDVNLKASFFLNRAFAEQLRRAGRAGSIVNFSSQGWWTGGLGGSVVYSGTKGGIVSMTRGLARTYAPEGIRVNAVAPGLVDTPMLLDGLGEGLIEKLVEQVPLGRMATPEEIAPSVVFLASDHAGYITGATLNISGGFLMY